MRAALWLAGRAAASRVGGMRRLQYQYVAHKLHPACFTSLIVLSYARAMQLNFFDALCS
jgi:hypothetical protein